MLPGKHHLMLTIIILSTYASLAGQYYGMKFYAHEYSLDQRSGLNLNPGKAQDINGNLELQFNLRLDPDNHSYFGYVFRLLVGNKNIDLIHGIFPDNPDNFELILGDRTSKIAFQVPLEDLFNDWLELRFELDFKTNKIRCHVNDMVLSDELTGFDDKSGFRLMFGAHSFGHFSSTDLPAMILRDVVVKNGKRHSYRWPLNETEGTIVHSIPTGNDGIASNPEWLLKHHNTWNKEFQLNLRGSVRSAYDAKNDKLYIVSKDSVHIYDMVNKVMQSIPQMSSSPTEYAGTLIFDTISHSLLCYSLDYNYITQFDISTGQWSAHEPGTMNETSYLHHNQLMAPDGTIYAFSGYGFHTYKNSLLALNSEEGQFEDLAYEGDLKPRYLAGSGYNHNDNLYYIIGGYGSTSGKQSESPEYYYELLSFSLSDLTFTKEHVFSDILAGFCFSNSVVIDEHNNMYALYFPKFQFNNKLQLVKIPLDNPDVIELGNPIDYSFLDVGSYADLHFCKRSKSLVAVSSYTAEGKTSLSVHTIASPPQKYNVQTVHTKKNNLYSGLILVFAILLIVAVYLVYKRYYKKEKIPASPLAEAPRIKTQKNHGNSIILFGGFQVIDKDGKDITARFTPLPKKLLLFILLHSLRNDKGVSSNTMYETFWFDKSVESARNNRAVNIVKLKSLLENLDTASISKDTGYWKFDFDPSKIYIDYYDYQEIVQSSSEPNKQDIVRLLSIVENSPFLNNTNADWLDPFKSDVSNEIIDTFLNYINTTSDDPEFLLHLTNCIFIFDAVSEEALKIKCKVLLKQGKHSLAKKAYSTFTNEFRQLYDEDYGLTFNQVIGED